MIVCVFSPVDVLSAGQNAQRGVGKVWRHGVGPRRSVRSGLDQGRAGAHNGRAHALGVLQPASVIYQLRDKGCWYALLPAFPDWLNKPCTIHTIQLKFLGWIRVFCWDG